MTERKDKLNKDFIIANALHLIDEEGLDSLSFRSLGKKLGVSQAAFYRHIPDKTALLNGITDTLWKEIFSILGTEIEESNDESDVMTWKDVIRIYGNTLYSVLHKHPHAVIVFVTRPMNTVRQYTLAASTLSQIAEMKISLPKNTMSLLNIVSCYVSGFVIAEITPAQGDDKVFTRAEIALAISQTGEDIQGILAPLLAPIQDENWVFGQQFEDGLESLIRGWQD